MKMGVHLDRALHERPDRRRLSGPHRGAGDVFHWIARRDELPSRMSWSAFPMMYVNLIWIWASGSFS